MTRKTKARALSALGVAIGCHGLAIAVYTARWPVVIVCAVFYGMTCAMAGVTWWETRGKPPPWDTRKCENCGRWTRVTTAGCDHCDIEDK